MQYVWFWCSHGTQTTPIDQLRERNPKEWEFWMYGAVQILSQEKSMDGEECWITLELNGRYLKNKWIFLIFRNTCQKGNEKMMLKIMVGFQ